MREYDLIADWYASTRRDRTGVPETRALASSLPRGSRVPANPATAEGAEGAAIAWGVIFHLPPADAIRAFASVSRVLKQGAPFLFTAGDVDGPEAKEDTMNGVVFRYYSFTVEQYRRILDDHRFALIDVHADSGKNTYYLAVRR